MMKFIVLEVVVIAMVIAIIFLSAKPVVKILLEVLA